LGLKYLNLHTGGLPNIDIFMCICQVKKETDIYERRAKVAINENVDRVYKDCGNQDGHDVCWPDGNISVSKYNLPDTGNFSAEFFDCGISSNISSVK